MVVIVVIIIPHSLLTKGKSEGAADFRASRA